MNHRAFDDSVRRRAAQEVFIMTERSENRVMHAVQSPKAHRTTPRLTLRVALVATLVLALLCGAAVAAGWGIEMLLTYPQEQDVQVVGKVIENDATRVEILDAVFDGNALALAWTVENKLDEPVYLLGDVLVNGECLDMGLMQNANEVLIQPGETLPCGVVQLLPEATDAKTCAFELRYTALTPNGEIVRIDPINATAEEDMAAATAAHTAHIDQLLSEGKLPMAGDGLIEVGSLMANAEWDSYKDLLLNLNLMEQAGELTETLTLTLTPHLRMGLSDGKPVEKAFEDYTMRVTRCDVTPLTVNVDVECVFANREAMERYADTLPSDQHDRMWTYRVQGDGKPLDCINAGGSSELSDEQADGSWVYTYSLTMLEPSFQPETLEITACRDVDGQYDVLFPEESITLTLQ